jgi:hypothetical protein
VSCPTPDEQQSARSGGFAGAVGACWQVCPVFGDCRQASSWFSASDTKRSQFARDGRTRSSDFSKAVHKKLLDTGAKERLHPHCQNALWQQDSFWSRHSSRFFVGSVMRLVENTGVAKTPPIHLRSFAHATLHFFCTRKASLLR